MEKHDMKFRKAFYLEFFIACKLYFRNVADFNHEAFPAKLSSKHDS